jgi:tetratricopeptide (TPR) repeat protein
MRSRTSFPVCQAVALFCLLWAGAVRVWAEDTAARFQEANRLYEEGKFNESAQAYAQMIQSGQVSASLYFNQGNACFKSGQIGRAIVDYQQAAALSPRDPDIAANLRFARGMVSGAKPYGTLWQRWLGKLTLNEWAGGTCFFLWSWFALLIAVQWRPEWRASLRHYIMVVGLAGALFLIAFGEVLYDRQYRPRAIVIVAEATVRHGPLAESQSFYTLPDGAEVNVLDRQGDWIQVSDAAKRIGWLRQEQAVQWPIKKIAT